MQAASLCIIPAMPENRIHNFNAGPAALPLPVLERVQNELTEFPGAGMSVMEMSHRSAQFEAINDGASEGIKKLLGLGDEKRRAVGGRVQRLVVWRLINFQSRLGANRTRRQSSGHRL